MTERQRKTKMMASKKSSSANPDVAAAPPPVPLVLAQQKYQGVERTGAGFKLLQRMGWREGEGLVSCLLEFQKENRGACQKTSRRRRRRLFGGFFLRR